MTLEERLQEAFDKRVCGTAMLPASDLLSAMGAIERLTAERDKLKAAVTIAAEQIRKCDYTLARSTLLEALKELK